MENLRAFETLVEVSLISGRIGRLNFKAPRLARKQLVGVDLDPHLEHERCIVFFFPFQVPIVTRIWNHNPGSPQIDCLLVLSHSALQRRILLGLVRSGATLPVQLAVHLWRHLQAGGWWLVSFAAFVRMRGSNGSSYWWQAARFCLEMCFDGEKVFWFSYHTKYQKVFSFSWKIGEMLRENTKAMATSLGNKSLCEAHLSFVLWALQLQILSSGKNMWLDDLPYSFPQHGDYVHWLLIRRGTDTHQTSSMLGWWAVIDLHQNQNTKACSGSAGHRVPALAA